MVVNNSIITMVAGDHVINVGHGFPMRTGIILNPDERTNLTGVGVNIHLCDCIEIIHQVNAEQDLGMLFQVLTILLS